MADSPSQLLERLTRLVQNDAHSGGLKPTQWEALRYIARANRFSRSPGACTTYLGMTKGTVSQTLQALERKGLIEKQTATDRRSVKLDLTSAGESMLANDPLRGLEASISAMPKSTQKALGSSLEALIKGMLSARGGAAFGVCKTCVHFQGRHECGSPHYCGLLNEPLSMADSEKICAERELA